MNAIHILIFLLLIGTSISAFKLGPAIDFWLVNSGFSALDNSYQFVNNAVYPVTAFIAVLNIIEILTNNPYISLGAANVSALFGLLQLYYGLNMRVFTHVVINRVMPQWMMMTNTPELDYMQLRFWCCGFQYIHQFWGDNCSYSPLPCAPNIFNMLSESIKATGVVYLSHSVVLFMIAIAFYSVTDKEGNINIKRAEFTRIERHNHNHHQESLLPEANEETPIEDEPIIIEKLDDIPIETPEFTKTLSQVQEELEMVPLKENV